jgi:hypothetical protein
MIVVPVRWAHMTEAVIRWAEDADVAAIVRLRREWTQEQEGESAGFGPANTLMLRPSPHVTTDNAPRSI